ncbi:glycine cleavage system aminomethyltransferase GcvT [Georgenia subflava]|uniref:Aminomethyltransferase n=1 Tax=Georgenia subflava TaxID=1622177 RepID=A0A6N7EKS3_9MICO|nr:glycine cleavage system aminomethyltransferase GcvT [Georgenia subflava]MPV37678.1 glycine cleavage system aminomethyltransferase GcvT [Georgenia subflava]
MTTEALRTPLFQVHRDSGATMTPFAGWNMPLRYTSDLAEHAAVRERAGLFDLSHMAQIEVSGPRAADALDGALVSRSSTLAVGKARYTMLTDAAGGILDDLIVYRLADTEFLVVANAANRTVVLDELTGRSGADVHVADRTEARALIALQGPAATEVLAGLTEHDLSTLRYYAAVTTDVAGIPVLLARTGYTGEVGFELSVPASSAVRLWQALLDAGAPAGVVPCGLACRDTLRLEAGMPLYGQELSREITPYEANMGRIVDLDHDFVGRDALAARHEAPSGARLVGLAGEGRRAARSGSTVHDAEGELGTVTSGVLSPTLGHPVAMALVESARAAVGTGLEVDVRGRRMPMTVVELPFYRRPR